MLPETRKLAIAFSQKTSPFRTIARLRSDCINASKGAETKPLVERGSRRYDTPFAIFDTTKHSKCQLTTRRPAILTWYSCGPTVYDSAHIGHAATFIRQDVIRRILEHLYKEVTLIQVMGITDIDDKIITKSNETGTEWTSISKYYENEFIEDLTSLKVIHPHSFTRVSDHIPQIMKFVKKLISNGYAYPVDDGSVYFDTERYGNRYGIFRQAAAVGNEEESQQDSTRSRKKSVRDFAVWKGAKAGEPFWESPWGLNRKGRPGWHIECSVMASEIFGTGLDLHSGGKDLIFPHHENEEAQCCAHHECPEWSSHWIHMGHLHFKGDINKMSKSIGNTVSIRSFIEKYSPDVLRIMCIVSRYRNDLEYSPDSIDNAQKILRKLQTFLSDTSAILNRSKLVQSSLDSSGALWNKLHIANNNLNAALLDDFDTPEAVKISTEFISDFNSHFENADPKKSYANPIDFELVLASQIFVQSFLNTVGVSGKVKAPWTDHGSNDLIMDRKLESVVDKFVKFRNDVRTFSLAINETNKDDRKAKIKERMELLCACDTARNELLTENNIEIKDHGNVSSWNFTENNNK